MNETCRYMGNALEKGGLLPHRGALHRTLNSLIMDTKSNFS